jgi:SepF-like predicted cell division protein (DUF552 family)
MIRKKRDKRIMANRIEDKFPSANASHEQIKEYHLKRIADLSNLSKLKNMSDSEIQELTDLKEQFRDIIYVCDEVVIGMHDLIKSTH